MLVKDLLKIILEARPDAEVIQRDHFGTPIELGPYNFEIEEDTGFLVIHAEDIGPEPD